MQQVLDQRVAEYRGNSLFFSSLRVHLGAARACHRGQLLYRITQTLQGLGYQLLLGPDQVALHCPGDHSLLGFAGGHTEVSQVSDWGIPNLERELRLQVRHIRVGVGIEHVALTLLRLQHHVAPVVQEHCDGLRELQLELPQTGCEVHELGHGQQVRAAATAPWVRVALNVGPGSRLDGHDGGNQGLGVQVLGVLASAGSIVGRLGVMGGLLVLSGELGFAYREGHNQRVVFDAHLKLLNPVGLVNKVK